MTNPAFQRALCACLVTLGGAALSLAAAQPALPQGATQPAPNTFYDLSEGHWAYEAVQELTRSGVLTGYPDGRFDGTRATTRYELAVVAARLFDYVEGRLRGAESGSSLEPSDYTRRLEARVAALEAALSASEGGALAPLGTPAPAPSKTQAPESVITIRPTPSAEVERVQEVAPGVEASAGDAVATPLPKLQVQFSAPPAYPFYIGLSPGVVSTAGDVYLSVQTGYDGLAGPVGPAARLTFNGGNRELRIAVDALARADILSEDLKVYGGLGFGGTVRPQGGSWLLEAPFGAEYFLTPRVGLYLQLTTSYGFTPINEVDAELSTGFNLRF